MRNVLLGVFLGALVLWFLPGPAHAAGALVLAAVLPGALLGALIERTRPLGIGPLGTVVASVSLTYVVGMAVNAVAALFGTAFTATWSLIGQALLIAVLLGICWWRLPRRIAVAIPAFPVRTALGLAALALLPLAAVGAASWLNNTGSSLGPLFVLAAVVVACAFAWLRPGSPLMLPALYASALAVMLLGAWRGDHFSGIDQSKEFFLADLVTRTGHWTPGLSIDAYNSSLGVTILPVHLSHLFGVDLSTAFRLLIPAGYALVPVLIASLYRHVRAPRIGVLAAFLFLAQPAFVDWGPVPVRQMVAFLFFAAAIRIMFDREAPARLRNVGLLATGALLILSHYSTAYLTLPLLVIGTVLAQIAQRRLRGRSSEPVLRANWAVLGLLVVFAVVWLGPITGVSSNLAETSRSSARVLSTTGFSPFGSVGYAPGTGLADQLGLGPQTQPRDEVFEDYQDYAEAKAGEIGIRPLTPREDAGPIWLLPADERPAEQTWWGSILLVLETVVKQMMRLLLAVGLVVVVVRFIRGRLPLPGLSSYAVAAGTLLGLVVVVPVASIAYDVGRTTQHLMVLLAGPIILGAEKLVRLVTLGRAREARAHTVLACLLLVLFAIVTGTVNRLTGVTAPSPTVRDAGELYEQSHVRAGEVRAAQWLHATRGPNEQIASGYFSGTRLQLAQLNRPVMMRDLFPWSIDREVYVYRGAWELETGEATFYYRGAYLAYPYPEAVIEAHKDTVYANSSTVIYR